MIIDLINEYIINNNVYIEIIPVLAGIIYYSKLEKTYRVFVWILVYSIFSEIFKTYYGTHIDIGQNRVWTNLYNSIYFSFLFWFFIQKSNNETFKKVIKILALCFFLSIGFEVFIQKIDYQYYYQVIPYIIGGVTVIICVFNYLISVITSKKIVNIYSDFLFWFVAAHFIYFLAFTPFKISENYFSLLHSFDEIFQIKIGATIVKSLLLTIGFIWTTRNKEI